MEKEVQAWLKDIKRSIDEIEEFLPERRDFSEARFKSQMQLLSLLIIGFLQK